MGAADKPDSAFIITTNIKNSGTTEAIETRIANRTVFVPPDRRFHPGTPPPFGSDYSVNLAPAAEVSSEVNAVFKPGMREALGAGTAKLYDYGVVTYKDVYGNRHGLQFCVVPNVERDRTEARGFFDRNW